MFRNRVSQVFIMYSTTSMLLDWNKPILKSIDNDKEIEARGLDNPRRTYSPTVRHGSQYSQRHQHHFSPSTASTDTLQSRNYQF